VLGASLMFAAGCGGGPPHRNVEGPSPCTGSRAQNEPWRVVLVVLENRTFDEVAHSSPYLDRLAGQCALAVDYSAVAHPSLPNYLALTSGSTWDVTSDCTRCRVRENSLFEELDRGWRAYLEAMPRPGYVGPVSGRYAKKHNPAAYYTPIATQYPRQAVPLGSTRTGPLIRDLRRGRLTRFSLIVPDLCNDEHDCSTDAGDRWLATWIPAIVGSPTYRSGRLVVFITYDEGAASDNRVYTVVVSRSIAPGTVLRMPLDHYSLLKTMQQLLGVGCLGKTCERATMSMIGALHLRLPT